MASLRPRKRWIQLPEDLPPAAASRKRFKRSHSVRNKVRSSKNYFKKAARSTVEVERNKNYRKTIQALFTLPQDMLDGFNEMTKKIILIAQEEARVLSHDLVGTEHILVGIAGDVSGIGSFFKLMGIGVKDLRLQVKNMVGIGQGYKNVQVPIALRSELSFTPRAMRIFDLSIRHAQALVAPNDLVLSIISESECMAYKLLEKMGVDFNYLKMVCQTGAKTEEAFRTAQYFRICGPQVIEKGCQGGDSGVASRTAQCFRICEPQSDQIIQGVYQSGDRRGVRAEAFRTAQYFRNCVPQSDQVIEGVCQNGDKGSARADSSRTTQCFRICEPQSDQVTKGVCQSGDRGGARAEASSICKPQDDEN